MSRRHQVERCNSYDPGTGAGGLKRKPGTPNGRGMGSSDCRDVKYLQMHLLPEVPY